MKNSNLIINAALAGGLILLYILFFNSKPSATVSEETTITTTDSVQEETVAPKSNIAYVTMDSVSFHYKMFKELSAEFKAKTQKKEKELQRKASKLQSDAAAFQQKMQMGITPQNMLQEEAYKLQKQEQDLALLEQQMRRDLANEEGKMTERMYDSLMIVVKKFNKEAGYDIIFNNAANSVVLLAGQKHNITDTILTLVNEKYVADSLAMATAPAKN